MIVITAIGLLLQTMPDERAPPSPHPSFPHSHFSFSSPSPHSPPPSIPFPILIPPSLPHSHSSSPFSFSSLSSPFLLHHILPPPPPSHSPFLSCPDSPLSPSPSPSPPNPQLSAPFDNGCHLTLIGDAVAITEGLRSYRTRLERPPPIPPHLPHPSYL